MGVQSAHLFCCSRSLVSGVQGDVENLPHAVVRRTLSHGKCRDSCGYYSLQSGPGTFELFSCFQKWRSTLLVNASQMIKAWRLLSATTWHKQVPRYDKCLNVKGNYCMWKSRQRYMLKLKYSVSVLLLLLKNILVWPNVIYFMDDLRILDSLHLRARELLIRVVSWVYNSTCNCLNYILI